MQIENFTVVLFVLFVQFKACYFCRRGFPGGSVEKNLPANRKGFSLWVLKIQLEKEMAAHSSILTWEIPWTGKSGGL